MFDIVSSDLTQMKKIKNRSFTVNLLLENVCLTVKK